MTGIDRHMNISIDQDKKNKRVFVHLHDRDPGSDPFILLDFFVYEQHQSHHQSFRLNTNIKEVLSEKEGLSKKNASRTGRDRNSSWREELDIGCFSQIWSKDLLTCIDSKSKSRLLVWASSCMKSDETVLRLGSHNSQSKLWRSIQL